MNVKNIDMIGIMNKLDTYGMKKLPQKISYAITKNIMIISNEYACYEATLNKIFDKYKDDMIKDDDGNVKYYKNGLPIVNKKSCDEYDNDLLELFEVEVNIDLYHIPKSTFDYSDESGKYDAMSAQDIMILQSILCNDKE